MKTIYLDLDGTVLDIRPKYYHLYVEIAHELGHQPLDQLDYWQVKRSGGGERVLNGWQATARQAFQLRWLDQIELPRWLAFDQLLPGVEATLPSLAQQHRIVLTTMRRNATSLRSQLRGLKLDRFFSAVIARGDFDGQVKSKATMIRLASPPEGDAIVFGDSNDDLQAARDLGVRAVLIATGIRDRQYLQGLAPDDIIDSFVEVPAAISNG